jgi:hypothetical protein
VRVRGADGDRTENREWKMKQKAAPCCILIHELDGYPYKNKMI